MNGRYTAFALLSVVRLEFRRHGRSRRTVGTLAGLTLFCTFWSVHNLSISVYPPDASLVNDGVFLIVDPGQDLLLLDAAISPFVGPLLLCVGVLLGVVRRHEHHVQDWSGNYSRMSSNRFPALKAWACAAEDQASRICEWGYTGAPVG